MVAHWAQNGIWQSITVAAPQKGAAFLFLWFSSLNLSAPRAAQSGSNCLQPNQIELRPGDACIPTLSLADSSNPAGTPT